MVKLQLEQQGISDDTVLDAFYSVGKEGFLPENLRAFAYADCELKNDEGFFLPRPYILAQAIETLSVFDGCKLLNIGANSYTVALFKFLGANVTVQDKNADKLAEVQSDFSESDVTFVQGTGMNGYPAGAPFDRIFVLKDCEDVTALKKQLTENGILVSIESGNKINVFINPNKNNKLSPQNM